jgi:CheY-like chemotaxis protein
MDGFTFLYHLRAQPKYARLPVIIATARVLSENERRNLETSTQHIIEKHSHSRQQLLELICDQIEAMVDQRTEPT